MNAAPVVLSPANQADEASPIQSVEPSGVGECGCAPQQIVGAVLRDSLTPEQREQAIRKAGDLIVRYMALANENGADYFTYRGLADRARLSMEALIKGRPADWKRQA